MFVLESSMGRYFVFLRGQRPATQAGGSKPRAGFKTCGDCPRICAVLGANWDCPPLPAGFETACNQIMATAVWPLRARTNRAEVCQKGGDFRRAPEGATQSPCPLSIKLSTKPEKCVDGQHLRSWCPGDRLGPKKPKRAQIRPFGRCGKLSAAKRLLKTAAEVQRSTGLRGQRQRFHRRGHGECNVMKSGIKDRADRHPTIPFFDFSASSAPSAFQHPRHAVPQRGPHALPQRLPIRCGPL
jgi:hypothetical protein